MLAVENISKSYGPVKALKNISLKIEKGSVFGILGPNGSGKTTLMGILLDVLIADEGHYEWFGGIPVAEARKQIGSLLETANFYPYLDAEENLEINARIKGLPAEEIEKAIEIVGLSARKTAKFKTYSLGMKQRLAIANALLGHPKVLLLDEPTNGLDPEGIAEIRELIKQLRLEGITVIIASHLLDEIEKVCTHVAILKKGELLLSGAVDEIFQMEDYVEVSASDALPLRELLLTMPDVRKVDVQGSVLRIFSEAGPAEINRFCFDKGITLSYLNKRKKSLEMQFMEWTKN
jgi:ABC-2 type transport system ATP-binding protein